MDYLQRFTQTHEDFRLPEVEALSKLANLPCTVVSYNQNSPFCILRFPTLVSQHHGSSDVECDRRSDDAATIAVSIDTRVRAFGGRSILAKGIYEIWGQGSTYDDLHDDVKRKSQHLWEAYRHRSFKFSVDCYGSTRAVEQQRQIINSFRYLDLRGEIKMKGPDVEFAVLEEWLPLMAGSGVQPEEVSAVDENADTSLRRIFLARKIGGSSRWLREKHDLKKRLYISTTSMDAELALLTAAMALARPGTIFLDPFVGTGGFMVAAAELGAVVLGTDIDGRSFRGKGTGLDQGVGANMQKYGLAHLLGDCMTSDLTNTPFRPSTISSKKDGGGWLDGIICDPPYGVREGLKVLGTKFRPSRAVDENTGDKETPGPVKSNNPQEPTMIDGVPAHTLPGYVAPKKPYSFTRMLNDILDFASRTLVDGGRLAFWMPSANENEFGEEEVTPIPVHPHLTLKHECVQRFNKWSRRLLVYERLPGSSDPERHVVEVAGREVAESNGLARTADELNPFRRSSHDLGSCAECLANEDIEMATA